MSPKTVEAFAGPKCVVDVLCNSQTHEVLFNVKKATSVHYVACESDTHKKSREGALN